MLKPEAALDSWREWDASLDTRPVVVGPLGGGRSNRSFLLASGGQKMVLRINGSEAALPNPDRANEVVIWRTASEVGVAPQILYTDSGSAFLVSVYIKNELPSRPQDNPVIAEKAFELLQRCHRLEVAAPVVNYAAHIGRYWRIIQNHQMPVNPALPKQRGPMQQLLEDIMSTSPEHGLCHHDPVVENFVGSPERLYLIDWEYAARGLQVMDYAALAVEWQLDGESLAHRAGIAPGLLAKAKSLYRYICALWEAVNTTG